MSQNENEWSPYHGHKFLVSGSYSDDIYLSDDPVKAITRWFKYQKNAPADVSISTPKREYAIELVKAATPELLKKLNLEYESPYKLDYLIEEAEKKAEERYSDFHEDQYGYGDTIHPFGVG